jgi:Rps23 Pro-64 3,4-dihydroxylase Tpa1-like proline 4-hydroxylase
MTRRFIGELSGEDCSGEAATLATWYRPGEYALPHQDSTGDDRRSVAYVWYLAKNWRNEWGRALFWCPTGQYFSPRFNTLLIFRTTPANIHFVCPVSPIATAKRLTINGFWHRQKSGGSLSPVDNDAIISPRVYGQREPDNLEGSIIVL